jgi:hypothetical protein
MFWHALRKADSAKEETLRSANLLSYKPLEQAGAIPKMKTVSLSPATGISASSRRNRLNYFIIKPAGREVPLVFSTMLSQPTPSQACRDHLCWFLQMGCCWAMDC